jgi:hypothetical protein
MPFAEPFGEGFAPLEPCPRRSWTNDQQTPGAKDVGNALREWLLWPDNNQADAVLYGELDQSRRVV